MSQGKPLNWYLEVSGTPTGPYTTEQVQSLFHNGEIRADQRLTPSPSTGQWITVTDFLAVYPLHDIPFAKEELDDSTIYESHIETARDPEFESDLRMDRESKLHSTRSVPRRPDEVEEPTGFISRESKAQDPSIHLFDALQIMRDRQSQSLVRNPLILPEAQTWGTMSRKAGVPAQIWLIGALSAVLGFSIWGIVRITSRGHTDGVELGRENKASRSRDPSPASVGGVQFSGSSVGKPASSSPPAARNITRGFNPPVAVRTVPQPVRLAVPSQPVAEPIRNEPEPVPPPQNDLQNDRAFTAQPPANANPVDPAIADPNNPSFPPPGSDATPGSIPVPPNFAPPDPNNPQQLTIPGQNLNPGQAPIDRFE